MGTLQNLQKLNTGLKFYDAKDAAFKKYGRVHKGFNLNKIIEYTNATFEIPDRVVYLQSHEGLENFSELARDIEKSVYGGMPLQMGICYGKNNMLDAFEYHKGSEVIIASTDMVLLLGNYNDIDFESGITYNSSLVEAFYIEKGNIVELYGGVLHYAPANAVPGGFRANIILPKGTNAKLEFVPGNSTEDSILTAVNKWLISCEDVAYGNHGIKGKNHKVITD